MTFTHATRRKFIPQRKYTFEEFLAAQVKRVKWRTGQLDRPMMANELEFYEPDPYTLARHSLPKWSSLQIADDDVLEVRR